ncbi:MAG: glycosyltransferase family 2 protein [Geminocystis sp.]|nr:glycosyltransferase family 2 protein [Geminocystis sp.]HIK38771.1 glycosyltransferase family 2 protein [Geminocystis sp. M7585_C2015_104]MCS7147880.1 glycosyltransferase family 2 protein [Geminocystis sp.]MCX8078706.1 glycosyltransferase family 2 protein [Geminocystis sp.]MDW8117032.1 glycosyltransferase family A protein [Geminocystis sp.]
MTQPGRRIVLISPVRDEEKYLEKTIQSVVSQTITPVEWVIVDDGSTDRTPEILARAAAQYPWIHVVRKPDRGKRSVGPGVVEAFYYGYERLKTKDYDYIGKLDGDLEFKPQYFATLLSYFEKDPHLGAASGKPYLLEGGKLIKERMADDMVAGQINFYRRQCFEDIGGFVREVHWDGIAFHRARMKGWRTRSIDDPNLQFIHQRLMGSSEKGIITGRLRWGRGQYFMGTHPLYIFAIGFYRMWERPYIIGGILIVVGYFLAMLQRMPRYNDPEFRKSLHAWQMARLGLGKPLETIPPPGGAEN